MEAWFSNTKRDFVAVKRTTQEQAIVDRQTTSLSLYHYDSCPFCQRVRHAIAALGITIKLADIMRDASHRQALLEGGGRATVPCLRIDDPAAGKPVTWLYESADIIRYLREHFEQAAKR